MDRVRSGALTFRYPVMRAWSEDERPPLKYPVGSWGPNAANQLFGQSGRRWRHNLNCYNEFEGE